MAIAKLLKMDLVLVSFIQAVISYVLTISIFLLGCKMTKVICRLFNISIRPPAPYNRTPTLYDFFMIVASAVLLFISFFLAFHIVKFFRAIAIPQ